MARFKEHIFTIPQDSEFKYRQSFALRKNYDGWSLTEYQDSHGWENYKHESLASMIKDLEAIVKNLKKIQKELGNG